MAAIFRATSAHYLLKDLPLIFFTFLKIFTYKKSVLLLFQTLAQLQQSAEVGD